jgi:glucokinase
MTSVTLVGDVGGTNCRFALAEVTDDGTIELHKSETYAVKDYASFDDAAQAYITSQNIKPKKAAFAFAGPKFGDEISMTNTDWVVSESALRQTFGFETVVILNDFVAMACGATVIPDDGFDTIIPGKVNYNKPVTVMGPGTGMGVSYILSASPPHVVPTEGGHVAFAPQDKLERKILKHQAALRPYVTIESLISGPGMVNLYQAICEIKDKKIRFRNAKEIVAAAEANPKSVARLTVKTFCNILGGFAGNTALIQGSSGGVVLAGGVSRHILPFISESEFTARFQGKDTGSYFVKDIPVRVIKAHFVALYGAAAMVLNR